MFRSWHSDSRVLLVVVVLGVLTINIVAHHGRRDVGGGLAPQLWHELLCEVLGIASSPGLVSLEDSVPVCLLSPSQHRSVSAPWRSDSLAEDGAPPDGESEGMAWPQDGVLRLLVPPALHVLPIDCQQEVAGLQPRGLRQGGDVDLQRETCYVSWQALTFEYLSSYLCLNRFSEDIGSYTYMRFRYRYIS